MSDNENILTLPLGYTYRSKPLEASELLHVDSFVALAISKDDESLDLRYLLHKDHITLEGMRDLLHSIQSVLDIDMYDFITEKQSLFFINPTCLSNPVLKNRYCKQVSISILYIGVGARDIVFFSLNDYMQLMIISFVDNAFRKRKTGPSQTIVCPKVLI